MIRYVYKGRFSLGREGSCLLCGASYGLSPGGRVCDATRCLQCGTRQCMVNGLGHGACSICLTGLLIGWSGDKRTCGYKACGNRAVASAPRVGFACRQHVYHEVNLLDRRATQFVAYDDAGHQFREVASDPEVFRSVGLLIPSDEHYRAVADAFAAEATRAREERWNKHG